MLAQPPVGKLRWMPPVYPKQSQEKIDSTFFGPCKVLPSMPYLDAMTNIHQPVPSLSPDPPACGINMSPRIPSLTSASLSTPAPSPGPLQRIAFPSPSGHPPTQTGAPGYLSLCSPLAAVVSLAVSIFHRNCRPTGSRAHRSIS